ncbi:hypothetical protein [Novosphingobium lindaniclasticum]|uniref:hypothetical protein n=1 Tax=Novosphingobium lindaniclasticum TaxID=1329895 RepID=UPI00240A3700|nr:hypothetical protein [Novosphingobium lindaniclasticum]
MLTKIAAACCALPAVPALASTPTPQTAPAAPAAVPGADAAKQDPIVCERVTEIGSRLRAKKICMTKSEWAEQRRGDRSNIERSQVQRGLDPVG